MGLFHNGRNPFPYTQRIAMMYSTPYYKQTDPAKQAGQIVNHDMVDDMIDHQASLTPAERRAIEDFGSEFCISTFPQSSKRTIQSE